MFAVGHWRWWFVEQWWQCRTRTQYDDDKSRRAYISGGSYVRAGVMILRLRGRYRRGATVVHCGGAVGPCRRGVHGEEAFVWVGTSRDWIMRSRWLHIVVEPPYMQPFVHW